jgi:acyl-CoA synthetase (AMP-forming)/AMP-acid ligase II
MIENDDWRAAHATGGQRFEDRRDTWSDLVACMLHRAREKSDGVYISGASREGTTTLTYGQLEARSRRLAAHLAGDLELGPGCMVALMPCNDLASVVAIYALMRIGCTIFFVSPDELPKRLEELLGSVPVTRLLCASPAVAARQPLARLLPNPDRLPNGELPEVALDSAMVALCFGTSGSTAASKIVMQAHRNASANAEALRGHHQLDAQTRLLGCLPIHHVNGLHFTIFATMWAGAHAMLMEGFEATFYRECIARFQPTLASVVPSLLEVLLLAGERPAFPEGFRYFVSAAAPLQASTCRAVMAEFGVRVIQGYGLTETTNFSATMPADIDDALYRRLMLDTDIPSIGTALHGNEVRILRADGQPAAHGEIGEVCMRGHNVMLGYHENEPATTEAFRGGWFHSQDLGYLVLDEASGRVFIVLTGREKNLAKVMGSAISLEEMERALCRHLAVRDAACLTIPDQLMGEAIVAVVVSDAHSGLVGAAALDAHLCDYFPPAALPVRYLRAARVPRTSTGKILRRQLPLLLDSASHESVHCAIEELAP